MSAPQEQAPDSPELSESQLSQISPLSKLSKLSTHSAHSPVRLSTKMVEKVWGRMTLPPPFAAPAGARIGEIWFEGEGEEQCGALLAKYLFTSEKLSVQCHPSDAQAPNGMRGKEECWLVLDADEDARLAIGFTEAIGAEAMRKAALDGSIEHLLEWHRAKRGDFFYLPAGTVHAIGPGLSLVEIQQNSDITYRLFDYGRPRELHLDAGVAVAQGSPYAPEMHQWVDLDAEDQAIEGMEAVGGVKGADDARAVISHLVDGPHFRLDLMSAPSTDATPRPRPPSSSAHSSASPSSPATIPATEAHQEANEAHQEARYRGFSQVAGAQMDILIARHNHTNCLILPLRGSTLIAGEEIAAGHCGACDDLSAAQFSAGGQWLLTSPVIEPNS